MSFESCAACPPDLAAFNVVQIYYRFCKLIVLIVEYPWASGIDETIYEREVLHVGKIDGIAKEDVGLLSFSYKLFLELL